MTFDLAATIRHYAASVESEPSPIGWRVTVTYRGQSVAFDYDPPADFEMAQRPPEAPQAVSWLWAKRACTRRGLGYFARLMGLKKGQPVDDAMRAKFEAWRAVGEQAAAVFGEGFGVSGNSEPEVDAVQEKAIRGD